MVPHQTIGINCVTALFLIVLQCLKKMLTIFIIFENLLSVDSSEYNVINTAIALYSRLSWHFYHPFLGFHICHRLSRKRGTREPSPCPPREPSPCPPTDQHFWQLNFIKRTVCVLQQHADRPMAILSYIPRNYSFSCVMKTQSHPLSCFSTVVFHRLH